MQADWLQKAAIVLANMNQYGRIEALLQDHEHSSLPTQLYYRSLQTLKIGLLLEEHEVRDRQRQIEQVQNRLISARADQMRSSSEQSEESQWKGPNLTYKVETNFHCNYSDLKIHSLLSHQQTDKIWTQSIFTLEYPQE